LRIVREVEYVLARNRPGDVLFVGQLVLVLFCIAIIRVLRLNEPMINLVAAVNFSPSPRMAAACSIHGAASKIYAWRAKAEVSK